MRGFNFESGQVFFVGCRCVWFIERVGGAGLKMSLGTLGVERLSKLLWRDILCPSDLYCISWFGGKGFFLLVSMCVGWVRVGN